jgi:Pretoxin HINT domain
VVETGQPYAYTGDNPVNWVDPLGLSFLDPSWAHKVIDRLERGADKVGHFVSTHKKAVITAAVIVATLPLDETGLGEVIDADVATAEATTDVATDVVADEVSDAAADEVSEQATEEEAEQATDESPSCGGQSFTPDTEVQLADGAKIPISQVKVGDMVLATDTATGKTEAEPVTTLWVNHDDDLMNVTVKTAGGTSTIKSTQHHLFWDLSTHAWVEAGDLSAGTALQTPTGATATVVKTTVVLGSADMWDLTVNSDHDFYVVVSAGSQTAVLVHNCPANANNYRANFTNENEMPDEYQVHHSLPQQYSELFEDSDTNIHDNQFLRGVDQATHQQITNAWRVWGAANSSPTAESVMDFAGDIDEQFGDSMIFPGG